MAEVKEFYSEEVYLKAEQKAISQLDESLALARSGSEEERRLCQSLTDLLKVHDARVQNEREHEYRMVQAGLEDEKVKAEVAVKQLEDIRKRREKYIDAVVTIGKVCLVLGVNAMFILTEYAWQNENTHLDALAREGRKELKKGFDNLFKKS